MWKNYAGLTSSETDNLVSWWNLEEAVGDNSTHVEDLVDTSTGSELNTTANAATPTPNEADGISGWTSTNSFGTFESTSVDKYTGSFSIHAAADGDNQLAKAPNITLVSGKTYRVSYYYKVINGDGDSELEVKAGSSDGGTQYFTERVTDGSWTQSIYYFTATGTTLYFQLWEKGTSNDTEFYFDSLSVKEVQGNIGELK
jgi:hypothetical protein